MEEDLLTPAVVLDPVLRGRIEKSVMAREQIVLFKILNIDFFPRESHLITFRDPWSFPILFHPACNNLIRKHMDDLAQKVCILQRTVNWASADDDIDCFLDSLRLRISWRIPSYPLLSTTKSIT